jgi:hypothetical protein
MSKISGGRKIFALAQHEVSIEVPCGSALDEQAFRIIMAASDVKEWGRALGDDDESTRLCRRDHDLIWRIGTASERKVVHRVVIFDWQSKTRGEVHFEECAAADNDWETIRNHWQYMLSAGDVEGMYPYLEFYVLEEDS